MVRHEDVKKGVILRGKKPRKLPRILDLEAKILDINLIKRLFKWRRILR
jgi:hypothetical protein